MSDWPPCLNGQESYHKIQLCDMVEICLSRHSADANLLHRDYTSVIRAKTSLIQQKAL